MGKSLKKNTNSSSTNERIAIIQNEVLDVLVKLGLTELQAKTYLTLTHLEKAGAKTISALSKIARQDIYRILPALEQLGLVEEIIASPKLYKAIPLSEGTLRLFEKRTEEHTKLKSTIKVLIEKSEENVDSAIQNGESEFVITSEKKRFVSKLEKAIASTSTCEMMFPGEAFGFIIFNFYECLASALLQGVKVRLITQKTEINTDTSRKLRALTANPNFEVKFVTSEIDLGVIILNNEVNIRLSEDKAVPSLWTNNSQFLRLTRTIFENQWNNSKTHEGNA